MIATKNKTFDDLNFLPHGNHSNAIQARLDLPNGIQISVVSMKGKETEFGGLYGSVLAGTYEVAVFRNDTMLPLSPFDDVRGWQTEDDLTELMGNLQGDREKIFDFVDGLHLARSEMRSHLDLDSPHRN